MKIYIYNWCETNSVFTCSNSMYYQFRLIEICTRFSPNIRAETFFKNLLIELNDQIQALLYFIRFYAQVNRPKLTRRDIKMSRYSYGAINVNRGLTGLVTG